MNENRKNYSKEEVYKATLEYFKGDDLATNVWVSKYCHKTENEDKTTSYHELTPEDMFHRLTAEFFRAGNNYKNPLSYDEIYNLFKDFKYVVPQGRPLAGIGVDDMVSLSNCFVIGRPNQDSYGTIMTLDQELVQLSKRGGGCIEENTNILTKERGMTPIKDVKIGEHVLSFNIKTHKDEWKRVRDKYPANVKLGEQIEVVYSNGTLLKTSKNHPILSLKNEGYTYESYNDGLNLNSVNKTLNLHEDEGVCKIYGNKENNDLAWLIGHHLGDGTCDFSIRTKTHRVRILGDNKTVISKYKEIIEKITESNSEVKLYNHPRYKKEVWMYASNKKSNKIFVENYIDNQIGKKTHTCFTPKFIKENDLYIPFLAGLIDADGHVRERGSLELTLVSERMMLDITEYLTLNQQYYKISKRIPSRPNESPIYRLKLYPNNKIYNQIREFIYHDKKRMEMYKPHTKLQSNTFKLTHSEVGKLVIGQLKVDDKDKSLYSTNNTNLWKRGGALSISALALALKYDVISEEEYNEIRSRVSVVDIIEDNKTKLNYIDIEVEENNNYYAGLFGLVNIHNCGIDLSDFRSSGSKVTNAAKTSSGPVELCANRFSNSIREVGQSGRRGALMLSMDINHPNAEEFMDSKMVDGKITGANISLKFNDEWLNEVVDNPNPDPEKLRLWKKFVRNNLKSAEPGSLFISTILRESVPDCYADFGFKTVSTNPCLVGSTKVMVADGRGEVTIQELAEIGKDVEVYAFDGDGKLVIRTMRNPRLTGYNQQIYKVTFDDGNFIRTTGNHKILLKNGEYTQVSNLQKGDSVDILVKEKKSFDNIITKTNKNSNNYYYVLNNSHNSKNILEHRFVYEHHNGNINSGVVHHKDKNTFNNTIDNLILMSKEDHNKLRGDEKLGNNNPIFKAIEDEAKFNNWKEKLSESCKGGLNGNSKNNTNDDILELGVKLTKSLGRRFSRNEWFKFAKDLNLPVQFTDYREDELETIYEFSFKCSDLCGFNNQEHDPRLLKTFNKMVDMGYNTIIDNHKVMVERVCEVCGGKFWTEYSRRERAICSNECTISYIAKNEVVSKKRYDSHMSFLNEQGEKNKKNQLSIFTKLKMELGREPKMKEWEDSCKKNNIPYRVGKISNRFFQSYEELKKEASNYNHRVVKIELDGFEDVYNGTVDEFHNFFIGGFDSINEFNKEKVTYINNMNCGEIILSPYDSCRLILINLFGYVVNPFTKNAYFDFNKFSEDSRKEMKLMDNMIDLELEKIDRIIKKVGNDPEEESIKKIEKDLWIKIKNTCLLGRRSGLGFTGEADMLAALGIRYGTSEAAKFAMLVQKVMALSIYNASCDLVQVDGREPFGCFDYELEKNNPFLNRLATISEDETNDELVVSLKNEFREKWSNGRRNIALLTVPPAGSISCLTQTTSGIEPLFLPKYKRKRKIDKNSGVKADFIDKTGDHFIEFNVVHRPIIEWYSTYKNIPFEEALREMEGMSDVEFDKYYEVSPYYKATANDCNWLEKVKMQGNIQSYVDHSISATTNLPKGTTEELVRELYETAWKVGCKGCTIYVDGSRDGILTSGKADKPCTEFMEKDAPKRPKSLPCKIIRFSNGGEKWIAAVGLFNGKPYEIFTGLLTKLDIPNGIEDGNIVRNKVKKMVFDEEMGVEMEKDVSRYDIQYKTQDGVIHVIEGVSTTFNKEYWNYGKLISGLLRHSMPLSYIIKVISSLDFKEDGINTWKKGVIRALKQFMRDGVETGDTCPECGTKLTYESGCIICKNCGYSKCG